MLCPLCSHTCSQGAEIRVFGPRSVPALNNTVYPTREQALAAVAGSIDIVACPHCGFTFNRDFDPAKACYDEDYDASRQHSSYYAAHQQERIDFLAHALTPEARVLEIGCGDGVFLSAVCDRIGCTGTGIDPGIGCAHSTDRLSFLPDRTALSENTRFDMVIMQHVLEHIPGPRAFVSDLTDCLDPGAALYIEVPSLEWIIENGMWFDFTFEHVNYFTATSLANLCRAVGFDVEQAGTSYEGQYLHVIGRYTGKPAAVPAMQCNPEALSRPRLEMEKRLSVLDEENRFAIWGASGKGVLFLSGLPEPLLRKVDFAVDINPAKQNRFLPLSGVRVAAPEELATNHPPVLIMNPAYESEIGDMIRRMGVQSRVSSVL